MVEHRLHGYHLWGCTQIIVTMLSTHRERHITRTRIDRQIATDA